MNATTYQNLAMRTKNHGLDGELPILIAALGLCGEAGEVAEHIKKRVAHSQPLNVEHLEKELGDVLWYVALMCDCAGLDMADVMEKNIHKLMERWPEGFDTALPQAAGDNQ